MLKLLFNIFLFYFSVFGLTSLINAQILLITHFYEKFSKNGVNQKLKCPKIPSKFVSKFCEVGTFPWVFEVRDKNLGFFYIAQAVREIIPCCYYKQSMPVWCGLPHRFLLLY